MYNIIYTGLTATYSALTNSVIVTILNENRSDYIDDVINYFGRITKASYFLPDLKQDIYLMLMNMDNDKINKLFKTNNLVSYVYITIKNNLKSTSSPFYKNYARYEDNRSELPNDLIDDSVANKEKVEYYKFKYEQVIHILNNKLEKNQKFYLYKKLFEMYYFEGKTYRQIATETGITLSNVFNYIKKTKEILRKYL